MRKQRHYSVFTLISFFLLFGFSGMILISSCRKTDSPAPQEKTNSELEQKFFNSHVSADPVVKSVSSFVKGQNDKHQFVEKLVKQIGFPYWDKAMTFSKVGGSTAGRGLTDSSYITYIPFVRDSQNFVNASLIIKIDQTDTAFRFLFDWQYDNYGFDSTSNDWNAKNVFHVFANFDRSIFGTTEFTITDGRIFGLDEDVHPTAKLVDTILSSGRSFLQAVTLCGTIEICVPGGQARNNIVPCNTVLQWVCTTVWLDIPPCCTTPPPPGGGGGSGTGSGWIPPPCGPNSSRGAVQEGCIPGWIPTGVPDDEIWSDFSNLTNPVNLPDDQVITNGASLQDLSWPPGMAEELRIREIEIILKT